MIYKKTLFHQCAKISLRKYIIYTIIECTKVSTDKGRYPANNETGNRILNEQFSKTGDRFNQHPFFNTSTTKSKNVRQEHGIFEVAFGAVSKQFISSSTSKTSAVICLTRESRFPTQFDLCPHSYVISLHTNFH